MDPNFYEDGSDVRGDGACSRVINCDEDGVVRRDHFGETMLCVKSGKVNFVFLLAAIAILAVGSYFIDTLPARVCNEGCTMDSCEIQNGVESTDQTPTYSIGDCTCPTERTDKYGNTVKCQKTVFANSSAKDQNLSGVFMVICGVCMIALCVFFCVINRSYKERQVELERQVAAATTLAAQQERLASIQYPAVGYIPGQPSPICLLGYPPILYGESSTASHQLLSASQNVVFGTVEPVCSDDAGKDEPSLQPNLNVLNAQIASVLYTHQPALPVSYCRHPSRIVPTGYDEVPNSSVIIHQHPPHSNQLVTERDVIHALAVSAKEPY